jgi:putative SOS response-associated peptidase YedK
MNILFLGVWLWKQFSEENKKEKEKISLNSKEKAFMFFAGMIKKEIF